MSSVNFQMATLYLTFEDLSKTVVNWRFFYQILLLINCSDEVWYKVSFEDKLTN